MNIRNLTLLILVVAAPMSWAHGQGAHTHDAGLVAGFLHPLGGLDHLLAMVAVGLWAAQQGGRALWLLPLSFVGAMAIGSALGVAGVALPGVEAGILLSVMALGLLVALQTRWSLQLGCAMVAFFALFHGVAHGQEMPLVASPLGYGAAMLAATAMLHAAGVLAGIKARAQTLRVVGAMVSLAGIVLLLPLAA